MMNLICKEPIGKCNRFGEPTWLEGIEYYVRNSSDDGIVVYKDIPFSGNYFLGRFETLQEAKVCIAENHTSALMPFLIKCAKKEGTFVKVAWKKENGEWVSEDGKYKIASAKDDPEYGDGFIAYEKIENGWKEFYRATTDPFYSVVRAKNWIDYIINSDRIHEERLAKLK